MNAGLAVTRAVVAPHLAGVDVEAPVTVVVAPGRGEAEAVVPRVEAHVVCDVDETPVAAA